MNEETLKFINDDNFDNLFDDLSKITKPIKPEIHAKNLQAIGLVIVKFQRLESNIRSFIGFLANIGGGGHLVDIFTVKSSFGNLVTILSSLAIENDFHRKDDLALLLKKAGKAEQIRNQLVHSVWTSGPRIKTTINSKKGVVHSSEHYEENELMDIASLIDKIDTAIFCMSHDWKDHCKKQGNTPKGVVYVDGDSG